MTLCAGSAGAFGRSGAADARGTRVTGVYARAGMDSRAPLCRS